MYFFYKKNYSNFKIKYLKIKFFLKKLSKIRNVQEKNKTLN